MVLSWSVNSIEISRVHLSLVFPLPFGLFLMMNMKCQSSTHQDTETVLYILSSVDFDIFGYYTYVSPLCPEWYQSIQEVPSQIHIEIFKYIQ